MDTTDGGMLETETFDTLRRQPVRGLDRAAGDDALAIAQHVALALILTVVLVCQARALAIVLRSRRAMSTKRLQRVTDMVWIAIPLLAVLFLTVRSFMLALDLGSPAAAEPTLDWQ